jgi:hypothetical protein
LRSCDRALDSLPEGPISSRPALKSVAQIRIQKGEAYARVEGPRGEVGCYLNRGWQREAVSDEVARRVVLEPVGAAARAARDTRSRTSWRSWARSIPFSARSIDEANPKTQNPNPKSQKGLVWDLRYGTWDLDLGFGTWDLGFK